MVDVDIGKFVDAEDFIGAGGEKNGVEVANIGMIFNDVLQNIACAFLSVGGELFVVLQGAFDLAARRFIGGP